MENFINKVQSHPEFKNWDLVTFLHNGTIFDEMLTISFNKMDVGSKGYITKADIQEHYKFSNKKSKLIWNAFTDDQKTINKETFIKQFKILIDLLY